MKMRPATEEYLALARQGRNQWWRYVLSVLVILLFVGALSGVPYLLFAHGREYSRLWFFVMLNLGSLVGLAGLAIAVVLIHRRSLKSLVTPHSRVDWRRVAQGFTVWFALSAVSSGIEALLFPGRYQLTFNPDVFFLTALAVLCLTPLQTTTEELMFRGYLMQALGLRVNKPLVIVIISSVIFMLPHLLNPEVAQHPWLAPPQYVAIGALLAAVTLRDGRLELAIGIHAANNIFSALVANYEDSVLTTDAIFTARMEPVFSLAALVVMCMAAYFIYFGRRAAGSGDRP